MSFLVAVPTFLACRWNLDLGPGCQYPQYRHSSVLLLLVEFFGWRCFLKPSSFAAASVGTPSSNFAQDASNLIFRSMSSLFAECFKRSAWKRVFLNSIAFLRSSVNGESYFLWHNPYPRIYATLTVPCWSCLVPYFRTGFSIYPCWQVEQSISWSMINLLQIFVIKSGGKL